MKMTLSVAAANAMGDALRAKIDAGGEAGWMHVYTGAMPEQPEDGVDPEARLSSHRLAYPAAAECEAAVLTLSGISEDPSCARDAAPTWVRFTDSAGNAVIDLDAGYRTGNAAIKFNTERLAADGPVRVRSVSIIMSRVSQSS